MSGRVALTERFAKGASTERRKSPIFYDDEVSASISSMRGPTVLSRRSPAWVGATLRVARVRSRTP